MAVYGDHPGTLTGNEKGGNQTITLPDGETNEVPLPMATSTRFSTRPRAAMTY